MPPLLHLTSQKPEAMLKTIFTGGVADAGVAGRGATYLCH